MEVDIFPSKADVDNSEGLCSELGSRKLIKRDGSTATVSNRPDDFSLSWRWVDIFGPLYFMLILVLQGNLKIRKKFMYITRMM